MDGIEVIVNRNDEELYYNIVNECGKYFNLIFEHEIYNKIIYQNVNSYIAQTKNGKLKQKGIFVENPVLSNRVDFLIITKAINQWFIYGIAPETTIKNCKDIYMFCASKKIDKSYKVLHNGLTVQRLNRFYASKGAYLYKEKKNNKNVIQNNHVLKASGVTLYNTKTDEFPTDINYKFYINEALSIILEIESNTNQLNLF